MEDIVEILIERETLNREQVEPYLWRVKTVTHRTPQEERILRTKPMAAKGRNGGNGKRR